jgi:isoleucyl-tRNA synthetase
MTYASEWKDYVTRQARWVDFDNDYKTLNPDYMESVSPGLRRSGGRPR